MRLGARWVASPFKACFGFERVFCQLAVARFLSNYPQMRLTRWPSLSPECDSWTLVVVIGLFVPASALVWLLAIKANRWPSGSSHFYSHDSKVFDLSILRRIRAIGVRPLLVSWKAVVVIDRVSCRFAFRQQAKSSCACWASLIMGPRVRLDCD